jgi:hypothetical protein
MPGSATTLAQSPAQMSFPSDAPYRQPRLIDADYGVTEPESQPQSCHRLSPVDKRIEEQRESLKVLLNEREKETGPLPKYTIADHSESCSRSHWARKIVLSFGEHSYLIHSLEEMLIIKDGGGVRGLCSLLILKMLMHHCEEIETGRQATKVSVSNLCYCMIMRQSFN